MSNDVVSAALTTALVHYGGKEPIVRDATEHGLEPGDVVNLRVTGHNTVYAFGEPT